MNGLKSLSFQDFVQLIKENLPLPAWFFYWHLLLPKKDYIVDLCEVHGSSTANEVLDILKEHEFLNEIEELVEKKWAIIVSEEPWYDGVDLLYGVSSNHVEKIIINFMPIEQIPDSIVNVKQLVDLCLVGNEIIEINEAIYLLDKLKFLNISANKIAQIPKNFKALQKKLFLDYEENPFLELLYDNEN